METLSLKTRKPVGKLCRKDFDTFPIWQYADDEEGQEGMDETWVRPVDSASVPRRSYSFGSVDLTWFPNAFLMLEKAPDFQGLLL